MNDILNHGIRYNVRNMFGTKGEIIEKIERLCDELLRDLDRPANAGGQLERRTVL
jgi:hypothetical protein